MSAIHKLLADRHNNPYGIGEDASSDEENGSESSEDELQDLLKEECTADFEQQMQLELTAANTNSASADTEAEISSLQNLKATDSVALEGNASGVGCYSEEYFSSGSDDDENLVGGVASKSQVRRKIRSDEDMFYDPNMDAEDESWVNQQRISHRKGNQKGEELVQDVSETSIGNKQKQRGSKNKSEAPKKKAPQSDAILSCPACLTTLCIDCQRHDIYHNQYRAMFVMNCCVIQDEVLRYNEPKHRHLGRKRKKQKTGKLVPSQAVQTAINRALPAEGPCETYHPVKCSECSTEVAVYDEDEVYHFFNILTSHA